MNRTGHNMDNRQDEMNRTGHNVGMNRTIWTGEGDMDRTGHNKDIDRMT